MMILALGILILLYPLFSIPTLLKRKEKTGHFFAPDTRILVAKRENMGNNLNMQNKYAFFIDFIVGLSLVCYGLYTILH
ncbi:hypothetical protein EsVE80_00680 [Enterococcus saigonensis]|uniref:Uncharacterized protein n=1 Tax=Enterococcus saigonensis TaxID=1805431 RepID=A0A679IH62_9ENTE|nr:hypothetical protein [Enterococcus saigonensis]BCA84545.1 hypothetical protein EsVE80_00680 [Enterococcus saigonensis]